MSSIQNIEVILAQNDFMINNIAIPSFLPLFIVKRFY